MRSLVFVIAMLAGLLCIGPMHAKAAPQPTIGIAATKAKVKSIEEIGWRRRYYRGGYVAPYAYYPPHTATTILRQRIMHLRIQRTPTMRRIGITDRITPPIIDSRGE